MSVAGVSVSRQSVRQGGLLVEEARAVIGDVRTSGMMQSTARASRRISGDLLVRLPGQWLAIRGPGRPASSCGPVSLGDSLAGAIRGHGRPASSCGPECLGDCSAGTIRGSVGSQTYECQSDLWTPRRAPPEAPENGRPSRVTWVTAMSAPIGQTPRLDASTKLAGSLGVGAKLSLKKLHCAVGGLWVPPPSDPKSRSEEGPSRDCSSLANR